MFNLLKDNHSTITHQEWPVFIKCFSDKFDLVLKKFNDMESKLSKLTQKEKELKVIIKDM